MSEKLYRAISRLKAWIKDYGYQKSPVFIDDLETVIAAIKPATNDSEYWYQCVVLSIHDGDTMTLKIDMGRRIYIEDSIRLHRINAPELSQAGGKEARNYLRSIVPIGAVVRVQTFKNARDKYGRWLGNVWYNGICVNDHMVDTGHAVYMM